jgi:hypothetical protein
MYKRERGEGGKRGRSKNLKIYGFEAGLSTEVVRA